MQDFPDDYIKLLQNSDLTNDNDRTFCIQAATLLTQALGVQLQPGLEIQLKEGVMNFCLLGMEKMSAIRQRRELLEQTQKAFSLRCKNFLSSKFVFHVSSLLYSIMFELVAFSSQKRTVNVLRSVVMNYHDMVKKSPDHFYPLVLSVNG